jgi:hypothetical protein
MTRRTIAVASDPEAINGHSRSCVVNGLPTPNQTDDGRELD